MLCALQQRDVLARFCADRKNIFRFVPRDHSKNTIIRTNNILIVVFCKQDALRATLKKVYDDNMKRFRGKINEGVLAYISCLLKIGWRKLVRNIGNGARR